MTTRDRLDRAWKAALSGPALALFLALFPLSPEAAAQIDSDGDLVLDSEECPGGTTPDTDGDGLDDCHDFDDDGDGVQTYTEGNGDTDGDGVPDYRDTDDDGDGVPTRDEITPSYSDDDGDGVLDHLDADEEDGPAADPDGDGLDNGDEERLGSDPQDADSDGDTVPDGEEVGAGSSARDTDRDGTPDIHDTDDDGDGIPTSVEHDPGAYNDQDIVWDDVDQDGTPNHRDVDSDGDGKSDHDEAFPPGSGLPQKFSELRLERTVSIQVSDLVHLIGLDYNFPDGDGDEIPNWLDSNDADGPDGDPDGDGVPNFREENLGTNPYDWDTDNDGVLDGDEHGDLDGDGVLNKLDPDDDGDGILTIDEGTRDLDGDGIPNYRDTDSDGDGKPDRDDENPMGPCSGPFGELQIPDGENTELGHCTDRDCDGIPDSFESQAEVYVGGEVHWFSRDENGKWQVMWIEEGHTIKPALCDGPCALEDFDCDLLPNCADPDWTDGPGENGAGHGNCNILN